MGVQEDWSPTLRIRKVRVVAERCHGGRHTTLRLKEAKAAVERCHGAGQPTLRLGEARMVDWRF